ncbi:MAG: hypothetical protein H6606_10590 [Flavobacteriales bacterium]|nr:hypothetical protein [Flavobacteriales bacterium]
MKKTRTLFAALSLSLLLASSSYAQDWKQVGGDVPGDGNTDNSGGAVSLSADGSTLAVGAVNDDDGGNNAGHVRVYSYTNHVWVQKGTDLDGSGAKNNDYFGTSVALSADGNVLVAGAIQNSPNSQNPDLEGYVRVFSWDGSTWNQMGSDLVGSASEDRFGTSVSINAAGTIIAVGAPQTGTNKGYARVYSWDGSSWNLVGSEFEGSANSDRFGSGVSLNAAGDIVAIGAIQNDDGPGSNGGAVYVYHWDGNSWGQLGSALYGEAGGENTGNAISLNAVGDILAIGSSSNDGTATNAGHVRVFKHNFDAATWNQLGSDIDGPVERDELGASVALSADGYTLVAGATQNYTGSPDPAGYVNVYTYNGSSWVTLGSTLSGTDDNGRYGSAVSVSSNGLRVAAGAPNHNPGGNNRGLVQTFQLCTPGLLYYRPSSFGMYNVSISGNDGSIRTLVLDGNEPYTYNWTGPTPANGANPTGLDAGSYYLEVIDENGCDYNGGPWNLREAP